MGTFGIFAMVVTLILIGYYVVTIKLDSRQFTTKNKTEDVEIIQTASKEHLDTDEEIPQKVEEEGFPHGSQYVEGEQKHESLPPGHERVASVEEIEHADPGKLYQSIQESKGSMVICKATAEIELSSEQYRLSTLEQMEESEKLVENFMDLPRMGI